MAQFVDVPVERLDAEVLAALLEEFASRDGTDYGAVECSLEKKTKQLLGKLQTSELHILYDADSEQWDLVDAETAFTLLAG